MVSLEKYKLSDSVLPSNLLFPQKLFRVIIYVITEWRQLRGIIELWKIAEFRAALAGDMVL